MKFLNFFKRKKTMVPIGTPGTGDTRSFQSELENGNEKSRFPGSFRSDKKYPSTKPNLELGSKVNIPTKKSFGIHIELSTVIEDANRMEQPFLYVSDICQHTPDNRWLICLSATLNSQSGDFFYADEDGITPYDEPGILLTVAEVLTEIKKMHLKKEKFEFNGIDHLLTLKQIFVLSMLLTSKTATQEELQTRYIAQIETHVKTKYRIDLLKVQQRRHLRWGVKRSLDKLMEKGIIECVENDGIKTFSLKTK